MADTGEPGLPAERAAEDYRSPVCRCNDCRNSDEAGCAVVMFGAEKERVQCGLPGGHDGSCDFWEKAHDERDVHGCCALVEGHDGCCAFMCSMCSGRGRLDCFPDDLGCDCGSCDGDGYCAECSGQGWFTDLGEACLVGWDEVRAWGTCDWGGCDDQAERFRWSAATCAWLPVCTAHREPVWVTDG